MSTEAGREQHFHENRGDIHLQMGRGNFSLFCVLRLQRGSFIQRLPECHGSLLDISVILILTGILLNISLSNLCSKHLTMHMFSLGKSTFLKGTPAQVILLDLWTSKSPVCGHENTGPALFLPSFKRRSGNFKKCIIHMIWGDFFSMQHWLLLHWVVYYHKRPHHM